MRLDPGLDFRDARYRPEVFQRFYEFHLRYRSHPGAVYYVLPHLAGARGWSPEEALWFAFINGNTQNPVTSLLLHAHSRTPAQAEGLVEAWRDGYPRLAFDTDRRHHKKALPAAVAGYLANLGGRPASDYWQDAAAGGWGTVWAAATAIPTFGRLSAWSFIEYLRLAGVPVDAPDLLLGDRAGSRSHRNGLCWVLGREDMDWHASNPTFDGVYPPLTLDWLESEGSFVLAEARRRAAGTPWAGDVSNLTLESALCTYKSWHRPRRRYPGVYNDLLYARLRAAEQAWPGVDLGDIWRARQDALPPYLRLEDSPHDPGCVAAKQDHYRLTGCPVMMHRDWPCFANPLNAAIDAGTLPLREAA